MAQLFEIVQYLDQLLNNVAFSDSSVNGLQVDSGSHEITKLAVAVDGAQSTIDQAVAANAQLLLVHHGLLWGECQRISENFGNKVRSLIQGGCSLYASHLPLDAHPEIGNNAILARLFQLRDLAPFAEYDGQKVGVMGCVENELPLQFFIDRCNELPGVATPLVLPFGRETVHTVGVVSGAGADALFPAVQEKLDLFVSGEPKHHIYHAAKELHINAIFAGHYATETVGVLALKEQLESLFNIEAIFIHEATGI